VRNYEKFLNKEIEYFFKKCVDPDTGLVRRRHFSSIRDHAIRKSSCYDNSMLALLCSEAKKLKLHVPCSFNHKKIIRENFWSGEYFKNDLVTDYVCADANIFPYWAGIFTEKSMMRKSFGAMQRMQLDVPLPVKYCRKEEKQAMIREEFFVPGWEMNMVWGHLGMIYIEVLAGIDKKKAQNHARQYARLVEQNGTFPEILTEQEKPYSSFFYHSDHGMLWSVMLLAQMKKN